MLKPFKYSSIALLCSMVIACSSGGQSQNTTAEKPQATPKMQPKMESPSEDNVTKQKEDKQTLAPIPKEKEDIASSEQAPSTPPSVEKKPQVTPKMQPKMENLSEDDVTKQKEDKQTLTPIPKEKEDIASSEQAPSTQPSVEEKPIFSVTVQAVKLPANYAVSATDETYKQAIEKLIVKEGRLDVSNPTQTETINNVSGKPEDDVGLSLLKSDPNSISRGFGKVQLFTDSKDYLLVKDLDLNEWKYQTFGFLTSTTQGAYGFVSLGEESKTLPKTGTATYKGIAFGTALEGSEGRPLEGLKDIVSNVTMSVDFGQKALTFETKETKGFKLVNSDSNENPIINYDAWNLTGSANWDESQKAFVGKVKLASDTASPTETSSLKGSFYGPDASEIGGTFHLKTDDKDYRGAFGGKK